MTLRELWLRFLRGKALAIFDGLAPIDAPTNAKLCPNSAFKELKQK